MKTALWILGIWTGLSVLFCIGWRLWLGPAPK